MQYLARREYSRAELAAKLRPYLALAENSLQPHDLIELLDELTTKGYLSDVRAATQWVQAKQARFGAQRIAHDLQQKGISAAIIEDNLAALTENEGVHAQAVWQRKFAKLPDTPKEKAKQIRFLQARGFSLDIIFKVLQASELVESTLED